MVDNNKSGHRERIRQRFLLGDENSRTDEALLELLLSYSIPQKDVQPLAQKLLTEYRDISGVLSAPAESLCRVTGIKSNSAVLLKLVDYIRRLVPQEKSGPASILTAVRQVSLFDLSKTEPADKSVCEASEAKVAVAPVKRRATQMFSPSALKEAIAILPTVPQSGSADEVRAFLRSHLHFNSEGTRTDYAGYIVKRMFPQGSIDAPLLTFASLFEGKRELRDTCFYRFCKSEPLMADAVVDLLLPAIGVGIITREAVRTYLGEKFGPSHKYIPKCAQAIVETLVAANLATSEKQAIAFAYRDILLPSFAFVLHSEFAEPGMYDISKLEESRAVKAMLWNPDRILPSLYELRNQGIISKISEIDNIRQFTTKWKLEEVVQHLANAGGRA